MNGCQSFAQGGLQKCWSTLNGEYNQPRASFLLEGSGIFLSLHGTETRLLNAGCGGLSDLWEVLFVSFPANSSVRKHITTELNGITSSNIWFVHFWIVGTQGKTEQTKFVRTCRTIHKTRVVTMKPVFKGTFVIIAICVLLHEHLEMATGQPRIEVSIGFKSYSFCLLQYYKHIADWQYYCRFLQLFLTKRT